MQRPKMSRRRFERLVARAVRDLPLSIKDRLANVAILVADYPSEEHFDDTRLDPSEVLFGLYQGTPLTARTSDYQLTLPDRITIFQGPIEESCVSDFAIRSEVQETVVHELAHHFGLSDEDLLQLGRD